MAKVYLPMTSAAAYEFFASNHKCNHAKAVMAHSATMQQANDTFWRRGFTLQMRKRFLKTYKKYLGQQDMSTIPMSPEVNPKTGEMYTFWMDELVDASEESLDEILGGTSVVVGVTAPTIDPLNFVLSKGRLTQSLGNNTYTLKGVTVSDKTVTITPPSGIGSISVSDFTIPTQTYHDVADVTVENDHWVVSLKSGGLTKMILKSDNYADITLIIISVDDKTLVNNTSTNIEWDSVNQQVATQGKKVTWGILNLPANAQVAWTSSDNNIAKITPNPDNEALCEIESVGNIGDEATIKAHVVWPVGGVMNYVDLSDTYQIPAIKVTSVSINPSTLSLNKGDKITPHVDILPVDATNKDLVWSITGSQLTINKDTGEIDATNILGNITATATAATKDGSNLSATVTINAMYV